LKGMRNLIDTNISMKFFLEFNPYMMTHHGIDLDLYLDYLFCICCHIYYIDETNMTKRPVNKQWLTDFAMSKAEDHHINLFGVRNSR
jgi:hypothetical protein